MRFLLKTITSTLFVLLCADSLFGQANTGRITGTVSDSSGAVVPNAKITIIAVETNRQQAYLSDGAGAYSSAPLQVGQYRVEAESSGFKRLIRDAISIQVQETAVVNLQLELGEV